MLKGNIACIENNMHKERSTIVNNSLKPYSEYSQVIEYLNKNQMWLMNIGELWLVGPRKFESH